MRSLFAILCCVLWTSGLRAEEEWTQFRGPNGTGHSKSTGLPTTWSEDSNIKWKTPIPEKGWSSPVVLGNQVWLTTAKEDGTAHWAICVDRETGKVMHTIKLFEVARPPYTFKKDYNSHASPTPVIEKGRVYVHFGSSGTACIDTESGKILWQRTDLTCDHWRAPGSSPILFDNLLILTFDGHDKQYVVALNKQTGENVWLQHRSYNFHTNDGDYKKAYSTPAIFEVESKLQLISPGGRGVVAYDPKTGKEIWKLEHKGMNSANPPVMGHGKVFVTLGNPAHLMAIRPTGTGDVTKTHIDSVFTKEVPQRPAPLILGDLLFMVSDNGRARCLETKTTEEVWSRPIAGTYYSSPVFADGHLFIFDKEGKSHVLKADRKGDVVATNRLKGGVIATPAIAGKALFVRTGTHLYRIEK